MVPGRRRLRLARNGQIPMAIGQPAEDDAGEQRPAGGADAADHREQQQRQALEQVKRSGLDRAERAGVERAADPGHGGGEGEDRRA